jgi:hypothetical protein
MLRSFSQADRDDMVENGMHCSKLTRYSITSSAAQI